MKVRVYSIQNYDLPFIEAAKQEQTRTAFYRRGINAGHGAYG